MLKQNEKIVLTGKEALQIVREIEYIRYSLASIARYYFHNEAIADEGRIEKYNSETTKFIDEKKIVNKLSKISAMICKKFDRSLGEDEMDDIERETEKIKMWEKPSD